ncbi:hypothetical protein [Limnospira platensis]
MDIKTLEEIRQKYNNLPSFRPLTGELVGLDSMDSIDLETQEMPKEVSVP